MPKAKSPSARKVTLRRMLEQRRRELAAQVREGVRSARVERSAHGRAATDMDDNGVAEQHDDLAMALVHMAAQTLRHLDAALRRLDQGTYGDCAECGEAIAAVRLAALPFAPRCLDCETAREKQSRRPVPGWTEPLFR